MTGLATVAAFVLASVLGWAGMAKLRRRPTTVSSFAGLGLPRPELLATAVPLTELAVAVVLLLLPRVGAVAAVALLAAFTVFLLSRIRAGASVGCGCFGSARSGPPSVVEVIRNLGLVVLALAAAATDRPAVPALPDVVTVLTTVAAGAVLLALLDVYVTTGRLLDNHLPRGPEEA